MKTIISFITPIIIAALSGCTVSVDGRVTASIGSNRQGHNGGGPVYNGLPTPTIQSLRSSGRDAAGVAAYAQAMGYRLQDITAERVARHCGPSCAPTRQSVVVKRVWVRTTQVPVAQPPQYLRAPSLQDALYQRPIGIDQCGRPIYPPEYQGDPRSVVYGARLWGGPQGHPGNFRPQHPGGQGGFGQRTVRGPNGETLRF